MKFFGTIVLFGFILLVISVKMRNMELGVTAFTMIIFGGFITLILASKSSKTPDDPSTNININHNHYDGNGKKK